MREYRKNSEVKKHHREYISSWREDEEIREVEKVKDKEYRSGWREDQDSREKERERDKE